MHARTTGFVAITWSVTGTVYAILPVRTFNILAGVCAESIGRITWPVGRTFNTSTQRDTVAIRTVLTIATAIATAVSTFSEVAGLSRSTEICPLICKAVTVIVEGITGL